MSLTDIYVYDRITGQTHRVGDDPHDSLYVRDGVVHYYNLQNGEGTHGDYNFVTSDCGEIITNPFERLNEDFSKFIKKIK